MVINSIGELSNSLGGFIPIIDSTGKITGYKTKAGADTVFPFNNLYDMQFASGNNISITLNHDAKCIYSIISYTNVDQVYSLTLNGNNIGLGPAIAETKSNSQYNKI